MSSWFSFGRKADATADPNTPVRALPAVWYTSPGMYELERRAIFSKRWILVAHNLRFVKAGDYVRITEAGFNFFLIKDRQGKVNAFHNVCRHRAYPVIQKEFGTASILACQYHGWSYGLNGKLAKAPRYQDLASFDKDQNGLYPIHTHVDRLGFIWVNLEAAEEPSISWEEELGDVDTQPRLADFDASKYHYDHSWDMVTKYNWKTLADNYNECYHCPTGHPCLRGISDLSSYKIDVSKGHIQHWNADIPDKKGLQVCSSFVYPNACFTVSEHFFYHMRCIPISATETKMEYDVFRGNHSSDDDFNWINDMFKQVLKEDKQLCEATYKNLQGGVFTNGELHPRAENGALHFQQYTRDIVMAHREEEEAVGSEIWPAMPKRAKSDKSDEEIAFCAKLDCIDGSMARKLAW